VIHLALPFSEQLIKARSLAAQGQFSLFIGLCEELLADASASPDPLAEVGVLYGEFGFASRAQRCYEQLLALRPGDLGTQANLATLLREMGEHAPSRCLYAQLQRHLPDHPVIRRNVLTGLEYDPLATDAERLNHARAWGQWAIARAGGPRPRPALRPLDHRLLRLGYISAERPPGPLFHILYSQTNSFSHKLLFVHNLSTKISYFPSPLSSTSNLYSFYL
jgi:tetratricopeptide (TPR) repeat protein